MYYVEVWLKDATTPMFLFDGGITSSKVLATKYKIEAFALIACSKLRVEIKGKYSLKLRRVEK